MMSVDEEPERAAEQEQQLIADLAEDEQRARPGSARGVSGHCGLPRWRRR